MCKKKNYGRLLNKWYEKKKILIITSTLYTKYYHGSVFGGFSPDLTAIYTMNGMKLMIYPNKQKILERVELWDYNYFFYADN